uniref:Uncharacterized protein n=1 Tax=Rhizophora mucronata TaxID=61149 RepID=A0A2P2K6Z0_RHIMU
MSDTEFIMMQKKDLSLEFIGNQSLLELLSERENHIYLSSKEKFL